ncbi:MAG: hypothetical protein ACMZ7B_09570 [Balneola sp.]
MKTLSKSIGIEFANETNFFSSDSSNGFGYEYEVFKKNGVVVYQLSNKAQITDNLNETARKVSANFPKGTRLLDFVTRYVFPKELISNVKIENKVISHNDTNKYYQFPIQKIELISREKIFRFKPNIKINTNDFRKVIYARDAKNEWVIHVRLLPKKGEYVTKVCNSWYNTQPIPSTLQSLFNYSGLSELTLYRNELNPYNKLIRNTLNLNTYKIIEISKDINIEIEVNIEW